MRAQVVGNDNIGASVLLFYTHTQHNTKGQFSLCPQFLALYFDRFKLPGIIENQLIDFECRCWLHAAARACL